MITLKYHKYLKKKLEYSISCAKNKIITNGKDFSRKRKLPFEDVIKISLSMDGGSIQKELYKYFHYDMNTATTSAYLQQLNKIDEAYFYDIFYEFSKYLQKDKFLKGWQLLACDGSIIKIHHDENDKETYIPRTRYSPYNSIRLNALYDLNNRIYTDIVIQKGIGNERRALYSMLERIPKNSKTIIIADRGYEAYNTLYYIGKRNLKYLIRIKDIGGNGILQSCSYTGSFDMDVTKVLGLTTKKSYVEQEDYMLVRDEHKMDFLDRKTKRFHTFKYRLIRFENTPNHYECLITNLDRKEFPTNIIKKLYSMRWGIETSFRELKYSIGLLNYHYKNKESIIKQIISSLITFNFCENIIQHIVINKMSTKYSYQANITLSIVFCKEFIRSRDKPINVEALIKSNILPIKENRSFNRNLIAKEVIGFYYRIAA